MEQCYGNVDTKIWVYLDSLIISSSPLEEHYEKTFKGLKECNLKPNQKKRKVKYIGRRDRNTSPGVSTHTHTHTHVRKNQAASSFPIKM